MDSSTRRATARRATPPPELGLREKKAAATRLAIVRALKQRLAATSLDAIAVDDLASDAGVSRMTFFNYFPAKDHAVDLLMLVWVYELQLAVHEAGLRGAAALELVFGMIGDELARAPARMRSLYAYFASRPADRPLPTLGPADREACAPGSTVHGVAVVTFGELLIGLIEEAHRDGEIELVGSSYELAHFLGAVAHGSALVGHSTADTDWAQLYRRHIRRALGRLGTGRGKDPKPPAIPEKYRKRRKP
jgi:AcrR family transcriptional regulator